MRLTHRKPALTHLRTGIRHLFPGYFALVMATGIISVAVGSGGAADLSAAMLVQGIVCYLVLIACYIWRFASYRPEFVADATGPRTAFSLFTFTAASDVLGSRLAGGGGRPRRHLGGVRRLGGPVRRHAGVFCGPYPRVPSDGAAISLSAPAGGQDSVVTAQRMRSGRARGPRIWPAAQVTAAGRRG